LDCHFDLLCRDKTATFEMPGRALVAGTPQEIMVIEAKAGIVPAGIAGVVIDHPVRGVKLVGRVGEAADHHHRGAGRPGQPGQAARQADEKSGVFQPARPFTQRPVAGLILGPPGDVVPQQLMTVQWLLVDADHPIAAIFQELDQLAPAGGIVPVFGLGRALHRDADVGLGDRGAAFLHGHPGRRLGGIDAEDVAGGAVQPDQTEITGLVDTFLVVEEQAQIVSGVKIGGIDRIGGEKGDVGIGWLEQVEQPGGHRASQSAAMHFSEADRIRQPAQGIPQGADRKLDQDPTVAAIVFVTEHRFFA